VKRRIHAERWPQESLWLQAESLAVLRRP
jgi:hypothetical protein